MSDGAMSPMDTDRPTCIKCGGSMTLTHDMTTDVSYGETWECDECGEEAIFTFDGGESVERRFERAMVRSKRQGPLPAPFGDRADTSMEGSK